jgi:hypothetical protein
VDFRLTGRIKALLIAFCLAQYHQIRVKDK